MCKYTCLDCKNYKSSSTKVVGRKVIGGIIGCVIYEPVIKEIPPHCDEHPRYFKKWWKENGEKKRDEAEQPKCLELTDSLKQLNEMIDLAKDILKKCDENNR